VTVLVPESAVVTVGVVTCGVSIVWRPWPWVGGGRSVGCCPKGVGDLPG
jgi:hypothetical protein